MDQQPIAINGGNATRCSNVVMWLFCIVLYALQFVFGVWSVVLEFTKQDYAMFGIIITFLVIPTLILCVISLVWYSDQDKVNKYLQQNRPNDRDTPNFVTLLGVGTVLSHITGFGVLYR